MIISIRPVLPSSFCDSHTNISVTECINELIAGLHQKEQSAYLSMLAQSEDDLRDGRTVTKTFAELEAMEHE